MMGEMFDVWLQSRCPVAGLPSARAACIVLGYVVFMAIIGQIFPGKVVPGVVLADKTRLYYKCNGNYLII
ncbi:hypothetical protein CBR_g23126 [Chara braunii]|uniref:Uncharacterized protein n=1 Tax=Chara braunii TaxID=69332 RepID=A0A388L3T7_CHABU|nr:hypothetical protein CBR_g23126 [Chara braunii]|eukprot:GBG76912.1 hypothetical protein CBR_g23126 [Chara braunii]